MTLTTPPIAEEPNSSADGPRRTSIRSAVSGLMATAWSGSDEDRSRLPMPSTRTRTRSPESPRRIGREAVGPKLDEVTPGKSFKVSPMLGADVMGQLFLVDHRDTAEDVAGRAAHAGDDDGLVGIGVGLGGVAGNRLGCFGRCGPGGRRDTRLLGRGGRSGKKAKNRRGREVGAVHRSSCWRVRRPLRQMIYYRKMDARRNGVHFRRAAGLALARRSARPAP